MAVLSKYKFLPTPVKASLWFVITSILQKGISFLTVPMFSRLLTPEQYGQYTVYQSWLSIFMIFSTLFLWGGVFNNGMIKYEDMRERFISSIQGLSTTLTILCLILYLIFRDYISSIIELPSFLILVMFAQILVTPALNYWSAKQRFDYKYKKLILITIGITVANPLVGLFAVYMTEEKGIARILSVVFVQIIFSIIIYFSNALKGKQFFNKEIWKLALSFNIPLIPHYLSEIILNQADVIIINNMVGTDKAGIYSIAYSVGTVLLIINTSINSSFVPWIYKRLKEQEYKEIGKISSYILLFIGILVLFLVAIAPEAIMLLAPVEYYEAIWIIPPISISVFLIFLYNLFVNVELYFEENRFVMIASIGAAVFNIILNYLLIPIFGYEVAAYTTLFCYILLSLSHYIFMKIICKKHIKGTHIYNVKSIFIIFTGMLLAIALLVFLYENIIIRYSFILIIISILTVKRKIVIQQIGIILKK